MVEKPYTTAQFAAACATLLGVGITGTDSFTVSYENGANFDGTETIREALDYLAEATQTIYFINSTGTLCFKQLSKEGNAVQWTIPTSLFNSLGATDKSIPIRLIVETFASNGVSLGQDIVDIAGYASEADCKPTLNPVFTITNPKTALTGSSSTAIVGYDTVSIAINPQTKYNATRTALSAKHGGTIVENSATPTFNVVNDSFQFSITDSRGYSTTQTATIPLV